MSTVSVSLPALIHASDKSFEAVEVLPSYLFTSEDNISWIGQPLAMGSQVQEPDLNGLRCETFAAFSHFMCLRGGRKRLITGFLGMYIH
jgi:hypothetical protein